MEVSVGACECARHRETKGAAWWSGIKTFQSPHRGGWSGTGGERFVSS